MKAITICQPYPRLILIGEKHVENRTWPTRYRGPLAIHAGKSRQWLDDGDEEEARQAGDPLVFGAIVGVCTLADCVPVEQIEAGLWDARFPQLANRAHCHGPWCWVLTDVRRLPAPVPWRGAQGLFDVPQSENRMTPLDAFQLAARLHSGQMDKARRPYIEHLARVFLRVQAAGGDDTQQIAALLHDCIEDDHATAESLRIAQVPNEALALVQALTRAHGQPYADYIASVKADPRAVLIKLADMEDNSDPSRLELLPEDVAQRLRKKYAQAIRILTN